MLAYRFTHFSGYIPCKVMSRYGAGIHTQIVVKLTAARGPYQRGEVQHVPAGDVVKRPLRVSRQHTGKLFGTTISAADIAALPVAPFSTPADLG